MSGVLPIGIGDARKLMKIITEDVKEYVTLMQLHTNQVDEDLIKTVGRKFVGEIYQKPPVRSSVKRRLRIKKVYDINFIEFKGNLVLFKISCEAGTYIRKICHDMGIILGYGAHMRELRRIRSGIFTEEMSVTLHQLSEALYMWKKCNDDSWLRKYLLPMEYGICNLPKVVTSNYAVDPLCHGYPLMIPGILAYERFRKGDLVAIITQRGELVAIGKAIVNSNDIETAKKGQALVPDKVFMEPGLYPQYKK
ncbi:tRNA pseudouridine(55) synthase TruB [Sulfolobales archaeon HS-7]|nr:tRNA pseudouridine(55) synthase TruB [Sulfolobales archaeon HS-7]